MITKQVFDALDDTFQCTLMSFCTVKTSADYQLKPPRQCKTQTAFAVIADILEEGSAEKPPVFLVESLTRLTPDEASDAPQHMKRRIQFASLAAQVQGKNNKREWTEDMNPAIAGKCRKLGRAPTNDLLQEYAFTKTAGID